jgi:hypothetical protein
MLKASAGSTRRAKLPFGITKRGTFTNITIFTEDGVVRVENGNVNAIWREREK